jgi:glycosyltransferase involved in cell wall biosynthesis
MNVSVVIPVYNRPGLVRRALASVNAQSHPPVRVIVVDDGSQDDTARSARDWLMENARFDWDVITIPNGGPAAARNAGAARIAGDVGYVAFLDSDDEWPGDFLSGCVERLARRPDAVGAVADRQTLRDGVPHALDDMGRFAADPFLFVLENGGGLVQCCVFRLSSFRRAGGFDARWRTGEDGKFLFGVAVHGPFLHSSGKPVIVHQRTATTADGDAMSVSLASARDYWIWADQMERMIAALPKGTRRERYDAICVIMLERWMVAKLTLQADGLTLLAGRAAWRRFLWKKRRRFRRLLTETRGWRGQARVSR